MKIQYALEKIFGKPEKYGDELRFNCTFCLRKRGTIDTKRCLSVNIKNKRYQCFRCEAKGRIDFLFKKHSIDFIEPSIPKSKWVEVMRYNLNRPRIISTGLPNILLPEYVPQTKPLTTTSNAYKYLKNRGITDDQIVKYDLKETMDGHVFIPMKFNNFMVYYQIRKINNEIPKYKNPDKNITGCHKNRILFNIDTVEKYDNVIICEGVFSAIGAGRNAIALLGKHASKSQRTQLLHRSFNKYFIALDGDTCGREKSIELMKWLLSKGKDAYIVNIPDGKDPGNYTIDLNDVITKDTLLKYELSLI